MLRILLPISLLIIYVLLLPTPAIAQTSDCPGAPPTYLYIGATATPNDVILGMMASPNGNWLYQVGFGETVTVLDGPMCSTGRWWLVKTVDGRQGWVKDGIYDIPWLTVTSGGGVIPGGVTSNPPPPADPLSCSGAPANFLSVGVTAWVIPNTSPNNVRSGPGTGYNVIAQAAPGVPFTIIDGPVCADNYRWWQLRMQNSSIGWTPDGTGSTPWLENGGYGGVIPPPVLTSTSPPTWTPYPTPTFVSLPTWTPIPTLTPVPFETATLHPSPTSLPQPPGGSIAVNNQTTVNLCEVRVDGSNLWPWYADPILPDTLSDSISLPSNVAYDIEVYDCDGTQVASFTDFLVKDGMQHNLQVGDPFTGAFIAVNQTSVQICFFSWLPTPSNDDWSQSQNGLSEILYPGEQAYIGDFPAGTYDLWVADCNNATEVATFYGQIVTAGVDTFVYIGSVFDEAPSSSFPDLDQDGLSDDDELWLAQSFNPWLIYDEGESADPYTEVVMLYQVTPDVDMDAYLTCDALITYVPHYPKDYGDTAADIGEHWGDNESIRVCARLNPFDEDSWSVYSILIKRHFDPQQGYILGQITFAENAHIKLWISEDKHAAYISPEECGAYDKVPKWWIPDFPFEDCSGGPELYLTIAPELNVGERNHPNFDLFSEAENPKLTGLFPNEYAWSNLPFCGSAPDRLIAQVVENCAGATGGKWWPPFLYTSYDNLQEGRIDLEEMNYQLAQLHE